MHTVINQVTRKEDSELGYNVWMPIYTKIDEKGETIVSDELYHFVNELGRAFLDDFLTLKTGHKPKDYTQIESIKDSMNEL